MIRVSLPAPLRALARIEDDVQIHIDGAVTQRSVVDAIEAQFPMLRGTIRDQKTQKRRAFVRFYALQEDLSNEPLDSPLPESVSSGREPYLIVGAMSGG